LGPGGGRTERWVPLARNTCLQSPDSQRAKKKREDIGVELYGFQQSLAKLQLQLEQTHQNFQVINRVRAQVRMSRGAQLARHQQCWRLLT
jgi:hypothetical protein